MLLGNSSLKDALSWDFTIKTLLPLQNTSTLIRPQSKVYYLLCPKLNIYLWPIKIFKDYCEKEFTETFYYNKVRVTVPLYTLFEEDHDFQKVHLLKVQ